MERLEQTLRNAATGLVRDPAGTAAEIGRRVFRWDRLHPRVAALREATRRSPLILQIETTNVCNAACRFCAYPQMQRKKGVMSMALFERIARQFSDMGGGSVSLTPVGGDALVDPHFMARLQVLEALPAIRQLSLTTNAIALGKYSDDEVRTILAAADAIQVSIGGLDATTYETLYGVKQFHNVQRAMERLLDLRDGVPGASSVAFAFRTNDPRFEARFGPQLEAYRRRGVFVSHISTYANYSGIVGEDAALKLRVHANRPRKRRVCALACLHVAVCWDGRITACGCTDMEGGSLVIGHAEKDALADVLSSEKRTRILDSFAKGKPPKLCQDCSGYHPDTIFARRFFRGVAPGKPLPLPFFHHFFGG
jgi:MoaA/NifB/PqqE/SkfB family radical SAM enzyme